MTHAGIVKKIYSYSVTLNDKTEFALKLKQAQNVWNTNRVATDFDYAFKFDLVSDESQADFSVNILDSTRGPYDTNWGREWTGLVLAHEVGHMLGLGDEYQTISGKFDCLMSSLMCSAWNGQLMKHHYYLALRRLVR